MAGSPSLLVQVGVGPVHDPRDVRIQIHLDDVGAPTEDVLLQVDPLVGEQDECVVAHVALDAMDDAEAGDALAIGAAALLKVYSFTRFRPSFDACVSCGRRLAFEEDGADAVLRDVVGDGGKLACGRLILGTSPATVRTSKPRRPSRREKNLTQRESCC